MGPCKRKLTAALTMPCSAPEIPLARRAAIKGVRLCVACQTEQDKQQTTSGYNRRGSKDSQLR
jgi:RNA polymerase-binding transcription factor DksA